MSLACWESQESYSVIGEHPSAFDLFLGIVTAPQKKELMKNQKEREKFG
jgi:hypothetical protein